MIMLQQSITQDRSMAECGSLVLLSNTKHTCAMEETAPPKCVTIAPVTKQFGFVFLVM